MVQWKLRIRKIGIYLKLRGKIATIFRISSGWDCFGCGSQWPSLHVNNYIDAINNF